MYCKKCGTKIIENAKFCRSCGYGTRGAVQAENKETIPKKNNYKSSKFKKIILITSSIILVGIIVVLGGFYFQKNYRVMKKSNLESVVRASEETNNKLSEANKAIEESNKQITTLNSSVSFWRSRSLQRSEPETVTEYVTEYVPVYDNSGVEDELRKLRRCIGSDYPGIWCI